MDKKEANQIINEQLKKYRSKTYKELTLLIGAEAITYEIPGKNNVKYQIEIQAFWDNKPNGDIRVSGSIDDCGLRAFFPLTEDFIKDSNNNFVGE